MTTCPGPSYTTGRARCRSGRVVMLDHGAWVATGRVCWVCGGVGVLGKGAA